ncbi:hypothetical protein BC827DRAFT_1157461 [Russula dissimulans]|nr:hypothetical protein BC827DRAFT_1157461 [Russula dissimulans]
MSSTPAPSTPQSNLDSIFNSAFRAYKKKTGKDITSHPLAAEIGACNSPDEILAVLRRQISALDQSQSDDEGPISTKWLIPTINVVYSFSAVVGEGVGLVFSPATVVSAGIGVLLLAAKDASGSQDILVDLFNRIGYFFRRLEIYTEVPPTSVMTDIIIEIMVEILLIVAMATKELKRGRFNLVQKSI